MRTVLKPVATTTKPTCSSHLQLPTYVCVCVRAAEREKESPNERECLSLCRSRTLHYIQTHTSIHMYVRSQLYDPLFSLLTCFFCLQLQKHIVTALCFHCECQWLCMCIGEHALAPPLREGGVSLSESAQRAMSERVAECAELSKCRRFCRTHCSAAAAAAAVGRRRASEFDSIAIICNILIGQCDPLTPP